MLRKPRDKTKNAACFRAWYRRNKDKRKAISKAYYQSHIRQARSWGLLRRYGITIDQWETLFQDQGQACAACRSSTPGHKKGWHTDHNHQTGVVRGILCHPCNLALGCAKEDAPRLHGLAAYVKEWQ